MALVNRHSTGSRTIVRVLDTLQRRYRGRGKTASDRVEPFEILIATILSARTKDETTHAVANALFARYPNARMLARASRKEVERLIRPIGFYHAKAHYVTRTSQALIDRYRGRVPRTLDALVSLPGVGRKTANIVRSYAFGEDAIAVDIHVHRISNRLGWVATKRPIDTEGALVRLVPLTHWSTVNDAFVKFGKDVCRPQRPQCWRCPVRRYCAFPEKSEAPTGRSTKKMLE